MSVQCILGYQNVAYTDLRLSELHSRQKWHHYIVYTLRSLRMCTSPPKGVVLPRESIWQAAARQQSNSMAASVSTKKGKQVFYLLYFRYLNISLIRTILRPKGFGLTEDALYMIMFDRRHAFIKAYSMVVHATRRRLIVPGVMCLCYSLATKHELSIIGSLVS